MKGDLPRISALADEDHKLFTRADGHSEYRERRLAVVLAQGGALHYLEGKTGIKDFDVWTFYATLPGKRFNFGIRKTDVDFGPSEHGRNLYPPDFDRPELPRWLRFAGRRVDFMIRGLTLPLDAPFAEVVNTLRQELTRGAAMPGTTAVAKGAGRWSGSPARATPYSTYSPASSAATCTTSSGCCSIRR